MQILFLEVKKAMEKGEEEKNLAKEKSFQLDR